MARAECAYHYFLFNQGVRHELLIFIIDVAVNLSSLVCELENQSRIWPSFLIYLFLGGGKSQFILCIISIQRPHKNMLVYVKLVNGGEKR